MRNKKTLMILLMAGMCMAACNNSGEVTEQTESTEVISQDENTEITGQVESTEVTSQADNTEVTEQPETSAEGAEGLYGEFLQGEEVLYFDEKKSINIDYIFDEFVPEENQLDYTKGYTLDETIELICGAIGDGCEIGTCKYYMIDAGQDGNLEMCIELSDFKAADWGNITLLVKDIEGKLRCRYCMVSRSRFSYDITYDGVIAGGGAGGAGYHTYDECVIDANGDSRFLYKTESIYPGYDSYISEDFQKVSPNLMDMLDRGYNVETVVAGFEDKSPTKDCVTEVAIYDTEFNLIEENEPIYDEIRQIFKDVGINVLNVGEMSSVIDKKCLDMGVSEEMRKSYDKREYHVIF